LDRIFHSSSRITTPNPIEANIDLVSAATLTVNPPTALALIREFVHLEAGDWIIQNAANSGVGRAVIQLAKSNERSP
jgi:trans-2-enoyl-CoA reductase